MSNKKARYEIRTWLGRYEKWLLVMKNGSVLEHHDQVLEQFLATFPDKRGLEEFSSIDVADYRVLREKKGVKPDTLRKELQILKAFWTWLTVDRELPLLPIYRAFDIKVEPAKLGPPNSFSLVSLERLLTHCHPIIAEVVLNIVTGKQGRCSRYRVNAIRAAAKQAGIRDFNMGMLKLGRRKRLSREIVQAYCDQLRDTLSSKSKTNGNSFAGIQLTPPDIRPAICDSTYTSSAVSGVDK